MAKANSRAKRSPSSGLSPEQAFGMVLRERRHAAAKTQADLESDTRVDRSFISQLENGQRQPCFKTIIQIALKLGITPGQLVDEAVDKIGAEFLDAMR